MIEAHALENFEIIGQGQMREKLILYLLCSFSLKG